MTEGYVNFNEISTNFLQKLFRYSGSDIAVVINDALMEPLREIQMSGYWKQVNYGNEKLLWIPCQNNDIDSHHISLNDLPSDLVAPPRPISIVTCYHKYRINQISI